MRYIAIDPGPHTGVAILDMDGESPRLTSTTLMVPEVPDFGDVLAYIGWYDDDLSQLERYGDPDDMFIVEQFRLRKGASLMGDTMHTAKLVAVCEWVFPYRVLQEPSSQSFASNRMVLEFRREYVQPYPSRLPHATAHEVSAIKHLIYYLRIHEPQMIDPIMRQLLENDND